MDSAPKANIFDAMKLDGEAKRIYQANAKLLKMAAKRPKHVDKVNEIKMNLMAINHMVWSRRITLFFSFDPKSQSHDWLF